ncbi:macro domain-containing protein [Prevotella sp. HUN102]|uniref:macro domain-containing protein n=1 Tax=Prevotella sp. HUN102 TaxID=1392486 RepID=UPI000490EDC0|nr:macro domain-containing protein [Prevotella sp. HUN102]
MIKYVSGNILQSKDQYIAQGVATGSQEGLGTGLAFKLSSQFPEIQKLFKKYTRNTKFQAGDIFIGEIKGRFPGIIYIATQPDMYHAELSFLNKGLKELKKICKSKGIKTVSLPKIGAGLGKLDWDNEVKPLLESILSDSETIFNVYEDYKIEYEN